MCDRLLGLAVDGGRGSCGGWAGGGEEVECDEEGDAVVVTLVVDCWSARRREAKLSRSAAESPASVQKDM